MTPRPSAGLSILRINAHFLFGAVMALIAWSIWPDTMQGWRWSLLSILLGFAAFGQCVMGARTAVTLYLRDRAFARLEAATRPSDPSELADQEALRRAGMLE